MAEKDSFLTTPYTSDEIEEIRKLLGSPPPFELDTPWCICFKLLATVDYLEQHVSA